jgi:hypothetical protein
LILTAALVVLLSACGFLQRDPNPEKLSPYRPSLKLVELFPQPGRISTQPRIRLQLSDYLEDDSFKSFNFMFLRSGGRVYGGTSTYSVVDRAIYFEPNQRLPSSLIFEVVINPDIKAEADIRIQIPDSLVAYQTSSSILAPRPVSQQPVTWSDIESIIQAECSNCHTEEPGSPVALTHDNLVGEKSRQVDRFLVKPGDASDSYLMQKLLEDYPGIRFTRQPPPWSENGPLSGNELKTIERWIEQGAPPPGNQ